MTITIKYKSSSQRLQQFGDWIDLAAAEDVQLKAGEYALIDLGIAMELPKGYEAYIVPRSSTFAKYGIMQANGFGIIDNAYSGDNDFWKMPVYATRDTEIKSGERICQFRVVPTMGNIVFSKVDQLENLDRGGFGSTGN